MHIYLTKSRVAAAVAASTLLLSGCASVMGVGDDEFSCPGLPKGVVCMRPSQVYQMTNNRDNLTSEMGKAGTAGNNPAADSLLNNMAGFGGGVLAGPMPVLEPARVVRIWLAPWIDDSGDLNYPSYVFSEVKGRRWTFGQRVARESPVLTPLQVIEAPPAPPMAVAQGTPQAAPQSPNLPQLPPPVPGAK